jgi:S1-C subfamily serine protease
LALLSCRLDPSEVAAAHWDKDQTPQIGDAGFAIGNPHGLGWTHSAGQLSQVRRRQSGLFSYRVIQSTAALNPGNSGGGLYDQQGRLIGINSLTGDKRVAEGLGFSIAFPTLLELLPPHFSLPEKSPETNTP